MSSSAFSSLPLSPEQLKNLSSLGYKQMTPVQAETLPHALKGKDLTAQAKTGSGKTVAFGIALLQHINPRFFGTQALVICPTRELAEQVGKEIRKLARNTANIKLVMLCGGKPIGPQIGSLEHGAHIVVGTPGRLQDHLKKRTLNLKQLKTLVLDEADRMLDMGFSEVMSDIIQHTPSSRQTLLFSATYPDSVKHMCRSIQRDAIIITVEHEHNDSVIEQLFYEVKKHERSDALLGLFQHYQPKTAIVFCHTKAQCGEMSEFLQDNNIEALAIHGDLDQRERDQVLVRFANNSCSVLVATDVAARGLDIKSIDMVINYELPRDPEIYIHRIGRTGRAGESGLAMSLFAERELFRVKAIEEYQNKPCRIDSPLSLDRDVSYKLYPPMATIQLDAGRKNKIRPGDILGALTGDAGLESSQIGKIDIADRSSYVALEHTAIRQALTYLTNGKVKGRNTKARKLR
jgi:ATP-independent RNA helicase DbpA